MTGHDTAAPAQLLLHRLRRPPFILPESVERAQLCLRKAPWDRTGCCDLFWLSAAPPRLPSYPHHPHVLRARRRLARWTPSAVSGYTPRTWPTWLRRACVQYPLVPHTIRGSSRSAGGGSLGAGARLRRSPSSALVSLPSAAPPEVTWLLASAVWTPREGSPPKYRRVVGLQRRLRPGRHAHERRRPRSRGSYRGDTFARQGRFAPLAPTGDTAPPSSCTATPTPPSRTRSPPANSAACRSWACAATSTRSPAPRTASSTAPPTTSAPSP